MSAAQWEYSIKSRRIIIFPLSMERKYTRKVQNSSFILNKKHFNQSGISNCKNIYLILETQSLKKKKKIKMMT